MLKVGKYGRYLPAHLLSKRLSSEHNKIQNTNEHNQAIQKTCSKDLIKNWVLLVPIPQTKNVEVHHYLITENDSENVSAD